MASNEVKIKVIIDSHTYSLTAARKDVNELGKSLANTDTVANALKSTFGKIALSLGGISAVGLAFKNITVAGIEANRSFENLKIQLTGLISANSSNVSLLGKTLDAHSKWNLGMAESEKILKKLNETNAKTKFTLEEIAGAFNMFYATSAGQGSRDKAVQAMDSIALAAQAVGKNIRDLTPMMDSLATGTVIAASEMGSFMKIVGLSNEELKKANENGKVYDYLIEKLTKFKELSGEAANGYEVALGSLKNELTELNKELSKPIFKALTTGMIGFSNLLRENKEDLVRYGNYLTEASKHLLLLAGSIAIAKVGMFTFSKAIDGIKYILPIFTGQIKLATLSTNAFNATLTTLKTAFKTFLPTAIVFGSFELLMRYFSDGKSEADKLTASLVKTTEEIRNLTKAQQQLGLMNASKRHSEVAKEILQMERELEKTEYRLQKAPVRPDGSTPFAAKYNEKIITLRADLEALRSEQQDLSKTISDYTQALYEGANSIADGLKNTTKDVVASSYTELEKSLEGVITPTKLKERLAELDKYISEGNGSTKMLEAARIEREKVVNQLNDLARKGSQNAQAMKSALKDIAEIDFSDIEIKTQGVFDKYNEILSLGIDKGKAKHFLDSKLEAIANENIKAVEKSEAEAIAKQLDLRVEYYKTIGEYERAWQIEKQKIIEKYEKLTFANGEKITKEQLDKLLKMEKTAFLQGAKIAKNSFKDIKGSWADTVSTMSKTVEDGFFNLFMRKTKDLKSALKDIGQNLFRDFMSPYARNLSQGIGGLFGSFLGGGSNLASLASFYGLSKSDTGSFVGEVAGTAVEIASNGEIIKGGSAFGGASNILSMASNLKTAYSLLTSGYTGMISSTLAPLSSLATTLYGAGYTSLGSGVLGFQYGAGTALGAYSGTGLANASLAAKVGGYTGAGMMGGAIGYGVGTLGDKLFNANSYASSVGAVGGALGGAASAGAFGAKIGSMVGPWGAVIGAVAGALIGGMFGKKKAIGSGISVEQDFTSGTNLNSEYIRSYVQMQKKGWFSKKEWKDYHDLGADILGNISSQVKQMEKLALRAGAVTSLTIKKGAYSGNSFSDVAITKAIISAMTGLDQEIWAEQISTTKKRKGFLGKLTNVYDKIMKYSPSTLANKATRPLDNALGRIMNKNGLGALHDQSIAGRVEIGDISDGKILDFEPTKKLEEKLGIIQEIQTKNMRQIVNPEIERMFQDWQEIAKKEKKNINEVITASLVSITDTYKSLALISQKNPLKQAQINIELMFEEFKDAAEGLKVEIPKNLSSIAELSAEEMATAYRKAIANDFTKENIDGLNSLVKVYQEARKAQEDYTKAVISFTQQAMSIQAGFYGANKIDTTFLGLGSIYRRFNTLLGGLNYDISDNQRKDVAKFGSATDIHSWSKYLLSLNSDQMQAFLSEGNTELRQELVKVLTEHKQTIDASGGKEGWIKSLVELEALNKQIAGLKLAEQAEKTLQLQREQLSVLSAQKSVIEKLGNIAQRIRDNVIDRQTSGINYQFALERARVAWENGDYNSKAFENLSNAANHQQQYFKDTAQTYEEYKLSMLAMAGEIENIADNTTLNDINKGIKRLEEQLKISNKTGEAQLTALEIQRMQLIENSQNQIKALDNLLGTDSPMIRYLRDVLEKLIIKDVPGGGKKPEIPNYTGGIENINSGIITKNGAMLLTTLDKDINNAYLSVLGRSVEQGGLDAWKDNINSGRMTLAELPNELRKTAIAITGSTRKEDWIAWYKSKGYVAMADGGIVTRPTRALIGEAGYSEAVIPLKNGRGVKVDMDGGFRILQRGIERLESVVRGMAKDIKEMALTDRGTTNGDERLVRLVGIPTVRIEK